MTDRVWSVGEALRDLRARCSASGLPVIDLGQGTPVDPTPAVITSALAVAADAPGYPPAHGTQALREAYSDWVHRRWGAALDPRAVIATVGSKELIATLPWMLGIGPGDTVVVPGLAYPTYAAGASFAGCRVVAADALTALGPARVSLVWLNTPGNPTGQVLPPEHLAKTVSWARERGAIVASDECYIELASPVGTSILAPEVSRNEFDGVLAVHSLSKRSSMAGYRCGFVAGDPALIERLLRRRRDAGLIVPSPVQAAARAALRDDDHVEELRRTYSARRRELRAALERAGFRIDHSEAGLFLWSTREQEDVETAGWFADRGVLVAPGGFYGAGGRRHVRLSLTSREIPEAVERIMSGSGT